MRVRQGSLGSGLRDPAACLSKLRDPPGADRSLSERVDWTLRGLKAVSEALKAEAEVSLGEPLTFTELVERYPPRQAEVRAPGTSASSLAEFAFCPVKAWHHAHGTPVERDAEAVRRLADGRSHHAANESAVLEAAKGAKVATEAQLADPHVDLLEMPEIGGVIQIDELLLWARCDGVSRAGGDLNIMELKTGRFTFGEDHILQALAYCAAMPGAMRNISPHFAARGVSFTLHYPKREQESGPHRFTRELLELTRLALRCAHELGSLYPPSDIAGRRPGKCDKCDFRNGCSWRLS